ncbi:TetR/AcrR family transcriptional regulator [Paenibacillus sp. SYP-B3998]|uniref:TetR/AcrR family transcriptional regulator n=1 Tax=Paenibacillus sp. SYP-B3998 TaxID=2678564 RepID=UPI0031F827EB
MGNNELSTSDKILAAAIALFEEAGFKSVTMKDIALASGVSEMTVFRHFGTKNGVLEAAINKYSYVQPMKKLFEEQIVWDLHKDLLLVAKTYHESMHRNRSVIFIAVQERNTMPWISELVYEIPKQLKELLGGYFREMREKGELIDTDPEAQAVAFMTMNHGYFSAHNPNIKAITEDVFIANSVQTFARGLKP